MSKKKLFNIDKNDLMFNNKVLFALLIPIVIEQLLNSFMGMVDTMMVSNLGINLYTVFADNDYDTENKKYCF